MNIIYEIEEKTKRYLPHDVKTRYHAVNMLRNGGSIEFVCRKYHISRTSLYRWNKVYDGNIDSLKDKSHRPHSKHPNAHTDEEITWIKNYLRRNPNITLNELWYKLRLNKGYTRHPASLYRFLRKMGLYKNINMKKTSIYIPKHYDTPKELGVKWQIDVKHVPSNCKCDNLPLDLKFYQYTCIDEASRERFIYHYDEHTPNSSCDFLYRCFLYFKYKPQEVQTDNGTEFTWNQERQQVMHPFTSLCIEEDIFHHKIRPRTPRHNGKVERSHRSDNQRFYYKLKFYSLEDLRYQAKLYLKRSNNIPMSVLNYKTPLEQRTLLETI
jgi:transposase